MIAPSVLSMDFSTMQESLDLVKKAGAPWIHYDVMDGHFVNNLTFGADVLSGIRKCSDLFLDVHLMIDNPKRYIPDFIKAGANSITVHVETIEHEDFLKVIETLHQQGIKVGITSKPKTDIDLLVPYLDKVDLVLVMSVEPGFGGQAFMPEALDKIKFFDDYRKSHNCKYLIEVDGGINLDTAAKVKQVGCDVLVAGSYVFKGDIIKNIESIK